MSLPEPRQVLDPTGAVPSVTPGYRDVEVFMDLVLEEPKRLNCYTGPTGTGKTFAVSLALGSRIDEVRTVYFALKDTPTRLMLMKLLAHALGVELTTRLNAHDIATYLLEHLNPTEDDPRKLCVVIDECQFMKSTACVEVMRGLAEHDMTSFTLLFVGGNGARAVLESEPMVWRRMVAPCKFRPLAEPELLAVLPGYCPSFYEGVDPELILEIDRTWWHGVIGYWAQFTGVSQFLGGPHEMTQLDRELYQMFLDSPYSGSLS
jgi:hypothetical protein